jgi:ADP-ribosylglycohydrolase
MTFCPGKKQRNSHSGHWDRDLVADLGVIKDWGAEALVSLMEPDELTSVGVGHLGDVVEALGLDWYHLPIRDVHPPGQRFENRWVLYGLRLRRLLRRGGQLVLHCRGGLGRTGTVAARLLVELGMGPSDAVAAARAARPGTIETTAQEAHVLAFMEPEHNEAYLDRVLGCLLGGAIGDAFGYAVEFDRLATIQQRFGPAGLREPVLNDGRMHVSDDTQMTLFTLEGLSRAPDDAAPDPLIASIRHAYADWLDTQGEQSKGYGVTGTLAKRMAMRHRRAPGMTCLSALSAGGHGTPERPINTSKGCGAVMRVAPIGWLTRHNRIATFDLAARAGALTHGHPDGWASAGMLAALISELFSGKGLRRALDDAKSITATYLAQNRIQADLLPTVASAEVCANRLRHDPCRAVARIGQGWVGEEALAIGLYATLTAGTFEDAVRRAANHDGDSDSTASIAGQIWGAWKGVDSLPMAWVRRLDVFPECLHGVAQLVGRGYSAAPTAAMRRNSVLDPTIRTCIAILEMVHVLHRRGYQRLRIAPGMAPSGCCWRVAVTPSDNVLPDHGAKLRTFEDAAHHVTGGGAYPFQWRDAQGKSPQELADLFLERFPELARRGQGADWPYAGWYLEVLAHAARGRFPVAYADWRDEPDPRYLVLYGREVTARDRLLAPPLPAPSLPDESTPETATEAESPASGEPS